MSYLLPGVLQLHSRSNITSQSHHYMSDTSELTDSELVKQVNELSHQVKMLTLENEIFEKTIMRLEPALMNGVQQALEYATRLQSDSSMTIGSLAGKSRISGFELTSAFSRILRSPSRVGSAAKKRQSSANLGSVLYGAGPRINVLERSELVSQEIGLIMLNHEKTEKKAAKEHAILQAKLEEIGTRVADVDKAVADFQQQVIVEGLDKIAQRIPAEVWIRFMTEWMKTTDLQIGKLRLRTSTLTTQYSKLRSQMLVKEELRKSIQPVDFKKLEIENATCQLLIEQKMKQLEELKQMTGDANLYLTRYKNAMTDQNNYLIKVHNSVKNRKDQTVRMNKEREFIKIQVDSLAQKLHKVQKIRQAYEVPDIMDYVGVKSEFTDLKHSVKRLESRLHIAQIAVASVARKLQSMHLLSKEESKKIMIY